jgi:hypothetical protein
MYTITKQFHFSASHVIEGLPEGHPCARLHGHNYIVELVLQAPTLDRIGFVVDYGDLRPFKQLLDTELDHRHHGRALGVLPAPARQGHLGPGGGGAGQRDAEDLGRVPALSATGAALDARVIA